MKCLGIQKYPGLGKDGLLWAGQRAGGGQQSFGLPSKSSPQTPHEKMVAWIQKHPDLVGKVIPSEIYNRELALDKIIVDELVKEELAYMKDDYPFLDEGARKYVG